MLLIFALAILASQAHADNQPSVEVSFANYGWELVEYQGEQPRIWDYHAVGLASFQWRLSHQWQGRRDTLAAAFFYKRIRFHEEGSRFFGHMSSLPNNLTLLPGHFELRWMHQWGRSFQTSLRLMPTIAAEERSDQNRYTAWGELLVKHKGLG